MKLLSWDKLPEKMQNDDVRPYYNLISKKRFELVLKRCFDVIGSVVLIVLSSPALLLISVWIKRDSSGPVFFKQTRVTQYGQEFSVIKFRTMVSDADKIGSQITASNDERITEVGRKIRDIRLDELPQLFNILKGDMTFVGTRPEVPKYVNYYTNEMLASLLLPAGVTSVASIQFKDEHVLLDGEDDIDKAYVNKVLPIKMKTNLNCLTNFSIWNDFKTLLLTIKVVIGK